MTSLGQSDFEIHSYYDKFTTDDELGEILKKKNDSVVKFHAWSAYKLTLENITFPQSVYYIHIMSCALVTDEAFNKTIKDCKDTVRDLVLDETNLTLGNVRHMKNLIHLSVSNCKKITNDTFNNFLSGAPHVKEIDISKTNLVPRDLQFPKSLEKLIICPKVDMKRDDIFKIYDFCDRKVEIFIRT